MRLIIGAPIERSELFTRHVAGERCSNGHEPTDPTHRWCPKCGTSFRARYREAPTDLCKRIVEHSRSRVELAQVAWETIDMTYWVHTFRTQDARLLDKGVVGQPVYVDNAIESYRTMVPYFKPEELPAQVEDVRAELEKLGLAVRGVRVYLLNT